MAGGSGKKNPWTLCVLAGALLLAACGIPKEAPTNTALPGPEAAAAAPQSAPDPTAASTPKPSPSPTPMPTPLEETVCLRAVGDLMISKPQLDAAKQPDGSYDFHETFAQITEELTQGADLTLGNLETAVATELKKPAGYPNFNAPDEWLDALKDAGFDLLVTGNNHALDQGFEGAYLTIDKIRARGMLCTGTNKSEEEAREPLIIEIRGVRVAILSYSYESRGDTDGFSQEKLKQYLYTLNRIDEGRMLTDMARARELGADVVIPYVHLGTEMETSPNRLQRELAQTLADGGADAVLFSHAHVVQPFGQVISADGRQVFVAYCLGNFTSQAVRPKVRAGLAVELNITVNRAQKAVTQVSVRYLPTYSHCNQINQQQHFIVLPAGAAARDESYEQLTRNKALDAYEHLVKRIGTEFGEPCESLLLQ